MVRVQLCCPIDLLSLCFYSDCEVFPKSHAAPFSKVLTFFRKEPFTLEAYYNNPKELPYPSTSIGTTSSASLRDMWTMSMDIKYGICPFLFVLLKTSYKAATRNLYFGFILAASVDKSDSVSQKEDCISHKHHCLLL